SAHAFLHALPLCLQCTHLVQVRRCAFQCNRKDHILMQSQVIVPLDGSASAEAILPHALLFAQRGQSILTLLQIVTPSDLPGVRDRMIPDNWSEGEEIWGQDYLATMARRLQSSGVTIQTLHPEATLAGQAIVSYTKHQPQVQLIALTTHGRGAAGRALFGSVAEQVFASVPTSLLLLHPPQGRADCFRAYRQYLLPDHHCPARWQRSGGTGPAPGYKSRPGV